MSLALALFCTHSLLIGAIGAGLSVGAPSTASVRAYHDLLASEPHVAGTPGDERTIERLKTAFESMGLEVEVHEFWPLLCKPIDAKLEIVQSPFEAPHSAASAPSNDAAPAADASSQPKRHGVIPLPIREDNLLEDPASAHPDLNYGWNAYSGSGDVTAEIIYVNYGTKADFQKLKELGVDCTGRIVMARYGGNFRGYKAKFAEEAGAAGLIIYTDPADSGYAKGLMYPEGGWANASCIQRGSLITLPYLGDPLTPFAPATKTATRISVDDVILPKIPVQPVGFAAAQAIMSKMRGQPAPHEWQGGLPFTYRIDGGPELKVHLMVKQERAVMRTANVIARLRGTEEPDREVIIGCHHDAWCFGAADPLAGTICLLESARTFAELAKTGWRPRRTITWAAWGAEEFGILGSVEWVEQYADQLSRSAVAYINLDMAAMGPNFGASSAPSLRTVIAEATKDVPACRVAGKSVFDAWVDGRKSMPPVSAGPERSAGESPTAGELAATFGELGGGSDHVGFYCHLGIPSCSFGGSGSEGNSYHSNYDNLLWYRKVVGEDYEPAAMVTAMTSAVVRRLADDPLLPLEPWRTSAAMAIHLRSLAAGAAKLSGNPGDAQQELELLAADFDSCANAIESAVVTFHSELAAGHKSRADQEKLNATLTQLERSWIDTQGLAGRSWFRNLYAATDRDSGYATSTAPMIREAVEDHDLAKFNEAIVRARQVLERLRSLGQELSNARPNP